MTYAKFPYYLPLVLLLVTVGNYLLLGYPLPDSLWTSYVLGLKLGWGTHASSSVPPSSMLVLPLFLGEMGANDDDDDDVAEERAQ